MEFLSLIIFQVIKKYDDKGLSKVYCTFITLLGEPRIIDEISQGKNLLGFWFKFYRAKEGSLVCY